MFKEIKDKIYEKLSEIESIGMVQDYVDLWASSYPAVMFEPSWWEQEAFSLSSTKRTYSFKIYIFQEFENIGKKQAWDIVLQVYDDILNKFVEDFTLAGLCVNLEAYQWEFDTLDSEDGKTIFWTIYLKVITN